MMLYNLLTTYRSHLEACYSPVTARTYYNRLCLLLANQSLTETALRLDMKLVLEKLATIKYKNHFSQSKNAFIHFCEFQHITIPKNVTEQILILESKCHRKYREQRSVCYKEILNKINHIKNEKLKLSFLTMCATGLRVSELAQISPSDCVITSDGINFSFIGKGGSKESVILTKEENAKLYERLKLLIKKTNQNKKVFYSAIYLQNKAKSLNFQCHDLRRAYAKIEYKKTKSQRKVMEKMRHSQLKNTYIYLRSNIDINK